MACYYNGLGDPKKVSGAFSFNVQLVLLSRGTDSVSSGNLPAFDAMRQSASDLRLHSSVSLTQLIIVTTVCIKETSFRYSLSKLTTREFSLL